MLSITDMIAQKKYFSEIVCDAHNMVSHAKLRDPLWKASEYKPSRFSIVPPCWWLVGWSRREEMWWNVRDMGVDDIRTLKNMRVYFTGFNCVSDLMINKPSRSQYQGIWHWTCMTGSSWTGGWGRFDQISNGRCDVIPCAYGLFLEQLFCNYSEVNH